MCIYICVYIYTYIYICVYIYIYIYIHTYTLTKCSKQNQLFHLVSYSRVIYTFRKPFGNLVLSNRIHNAKAIDDFHHHPSHPLMSVEH